MKKKIIIKGPLLSQSGYGTQARFALRALRAYEEYFDIYLINLNWGATGWVWQDNEERRYIDNILGKTAQYIHQCQQNKTNPDFDLSLQITIPTEFERMARVNIGYTAGVESTKISSKWVEKCMLMDKIILTSNHSKYGFENTTYQAQNQQTGEIIQDFRCQAPLHVVNYPVWSYEPAKIDLDLKHDFNFLCVSQWGPRKNFTNTIAWFVEEFIDVEVGLVLKTSIKNNSLLDKVRVENELKKILSKYPDRKCSVSLLHGDMSDNEMAAVYQHPKIKALISITHGEGFGLPIFEAITNDLPVITCVWGGQTDFIFADKKIKKNGKQKIVKRPLVASVEYDIRKIQKEAVWKGVIEEDSSWCFPKQGSYKLTLRDVYKNYGKYLKDVKILNKHNKKVFTEENQYKKFTEIVLGQQIVKFDVNELPKISIITSVYDGAEYIEDFLKDITSQTIFDDKCELVLIHPKTSPGFKEENEVIKKYQRDNIIHKVLTKDPGIYACWNKGVEVATGQYITNANLDDRKAKYSLKEYAKELFLNPEVDVIYADGFITDKPNETFENNSSNGRKYSFPEFSFQNLQMMNLPHQCPLWRKSLHDKYGLFDDSFRSAGDWEFWLRCASNGVKMKKINEVLNLYYFSPRGISTDPNNFSWKREEEKRVFEKYKDLKVE
jgi:hypothetical protein